jgi:hypothetical protein
LTILTKSGALVLYVLHQAKSEPQNSWVPYNTIDQLLAVLKSLKASSSFPEETKRYDAVVVDIQSSLASYFSSKSMLV